MTLIITGEGGAIILCLTSKMAIYSSAIALVQVLSLILYTFLYFSFKHANSNHDQKNIMLRLAQYSQPDA